MKRTGNHSHYENAVESYLRHLGVTYLPVNEGKKSAFNGRKIKNFDFVIPGKSLKLIEVKGRNFGYKGAPSNKWENWVLEDDIKSLKTWQKVFSQKGKSAKSFLLYAFLLTNKSDKDFFETVWKHKGKNYGLSIIDIDTYYIHSKRRSITPNSFCVSRRVFSGLLEPISNIFQ